MIDIVRDELIDLHEVARRFERSYAAVAGWVFKGRLEARKVGETWYTTAEALNDMAWRDTERRVQPQVSLGERRAAAAVAVREAQIDQARLAVARDSGVAALARHGVVREGRA